MDLSTGIGHDILAFRHPQADLHSIWRDLGPNERVKAFKSWLGDPRSQPNLFFIDDLDAIESDAAIKDALPRGAYVILYSTRDPSIHSSLQWNCEELRVSTMDVDEMATLMNTILTRGGLRLYGMDFREEELEELARAVDGHALAASRAIYYVVQVLAQSTLEPPVKAFLKILSGNDWKARSRFLHYKPRFGFSVMETFEVSLQHLRRHKEAATELLELIATLSNADMSLDFRKFLNIRRPWLPRVESKLANFQVFKNGLEGQSDYLAELESVSIGFRPSLNRPLRLHPLWTECTLQRIHHEDRVRWLHQILFLCFTPSFYNDDDEADLLHQFAKNCFNIMERFQIGLTEITQSGKFLAWIKDLQSRGNEAHDAPEDRSFTDSRDQREENLDVLDELGAAVEANPARRAISELQKECVDLAPAVYRQRSAEATNEMYEILQMQLVSILKSLQTFKIKKDNNNWKGSETLRLHLEVYNFIIWIASEPCFRTRNPTLLNRLQARREALLSQSSRNEAS